MPVVELQFLIDQHGAEKVRAELGRLTGATKQAASAAVPLQSQLSKLGSAITGPLGVATGVALATKKLIDFGEAAAHTDKQRAAFEKFNATMGVAERQVGEAVAGLLSMDGVLDTIGTVVGATTEVISSLGGALEALEPVVWLVGKAVEIAVAPFVALARAGEWLVETATEIIPGLESTADATDEAARAAERAADKFFGLSEATASVNAQLAAQISLRRAEADADKARKAAAQRDFDTEKDREARLSRAVDLARKGTDSIRRNEDELRESLGDLRKEALRSEEALAMLAEDAPGRTAAQEAYNAANVAYLDVAGAIEGLDAKRARSTAEVRTETEKLTLTLRDIEFALYDVRVAASGLFAPLAEWPDMLAGANALALIQRNVRSVGTVLDRVSDKWSAFNDRLTESREAQEALDAATQKRNDAVWAGVEGGAALVKTIAGNAWVDAVLGAALETAKGIGTIISNPAESVTHFASAAQFLVAQAIAESKGGGSGAVSSAGAAAPAVSSAPKSVLDRNEQQDSETNLAIYVDGRVLGEVAATGINKAGRRGTAVLDRRTQGQRNSRRGLT